MRNERRPGSRYASMDQCRWELRRAKSLFEGNRLPTVDSSAKSVEEICALILQTRKIRAKTAERVRRHQEENPA